MNFRPRRDQAVGRIVIRLTDSAIVRPDETKNTSKFMLIDAVGPGIEDLKVGMIVMPTKINGISLEGGASFRPMAKDEHMELTVEDWTSLDEFKVQNESGSEYVPFSDPRAAKSLGKSSVKSAAENGVESRP